MKHFVIEFTNGFDQKEYLGQWGFVRSFDEAKILTEDDQKDYIDWVKENEWRLPPIVLTAEPRFVRISLN